jgi:hypothetical protein
MIFKINNAAQAGRIPSKPRFESKVQPPVGEDCGRNILEFPRTPMNSYNPEILAPPEIASAPLSQSQNNITGRNETKVPS